MIVRVVCDGRDVVTHRIDELLDLLCFFRVRDLKCSDVQAILGHEPEVWGTISAALRLPFKTYSEQQCASLAGLDGSTA